MKKIIITILILFSIISFSHAQIKLHGRIADKQNNESIQGASITLRNIDSVYITGTATNEKGIFQISSTRKEKQVILQITNIGYKPQTIRINPESTKNDLGTIALESTSYALKSAVITAKAIIHKVDRDVIIPSEAQIKESDNALNLLQNLQLNRIMVNPVSDQITTTSGETVQLRINDREASLSEVKMIKPEDIVKVEYVDTPELRYHNSASVINYIVKRHYTGGYVGYNSTNMLAKYGQNYNGISGKFNYKKSQFSLYGDWMDSRARFLAHNDQQYIYRDGHMFDRTEDNTPNKYKEHIYHYALSYNLTEPDKYMLNVTFRNEINNIPTDFTDKDGTVQTSSHSGLYNVSQHSTSSENRPTLDLYFTYKLPHKQKFSVNAVGTRIGTENTRQYKEFDQTSTFTDIYSHIKGKKYSLIAEANYEKDFKKSQLIAGVRHLQSFANNLYDGNPTASVNLNNSQTYLFGEYLIKYKKFSYDLGVGGIRIYDRQNEVHNNTYIFQPSLGIKYNPNDDIYFKYKGYISNDTPSLSDLNNVDQFLDSLQLYRGNPYLKPCSFYNNQLTMGYSKKWFGVDLYFNYKYTNKPIMDETYFDGNWFVTQKINQKAFHEFKFQSSFTFRPFKDYITLQVAPGYNYYNSIGKNYNYTYDLFKIDVSLNAHYKKWSFYASYNSAPKELMGETIIKPTDQDMWMIGYHEQKWSVSLGAYDLFHKAYTEDHINLSKVMPSFYHSISYTATQRILIRLSVNLDFGHKHKSMQKTLNNEDNDSGILTGVK